VARLVTASVTSAKSIGQFLPLAGQSWRAADRHYLSVHSPFARRTLRDMPHVLSYHINRADAAFDLNGGWAQRPAAFRFMILRFEPGRSLEFPPDVRVRIAEDHRNFLRELRGFAVAEDVLVDRLNGQTALVKYLAEYERPDGSAAEEFDSRLHTLGERLREQAEGAFGLRQIVLNRVLAEGVAEPIDEPGQRPTDRTLPETTKQGFLELYFDHRDWAEQWFARPAVRTTIADPHWAVARAYRVTEECGLDRR
jgi:hypothetical protein